MFAQRSEIEVRSGVIFFFFSSLRLVFQFPCQKFFSSIQMQYNTFCTPKIISNKIIFRASVAKISFYPTSPKFNTLKCTLLRTNISFQEYNELDEDTRNFCNQFAIFVLQVQPPTYTTKDRHGRKRRGVQMLQGPRYRAKLRGSTFPSTQAV